MKQFTWKKVLQKCNKNCCGTNWNAIQCKTFINTARKHFATVLGLANLRNSWNKNFVSSWLSSRSYFKLSIFSEKYKSILSWRHCISRCVLETCTSFEKQSLSFDDERFTDDVELLVFFSVYVSKSSTEE